MAKNVLKCFVFVIRLTSRLVTKSGWPVRNSNPRPWTRVDCPRSTCTRGRRKKKNVAAIIFLHPRLKQNKYCLDPLVAAVPAGGEGGRGGSVNDQPRGAVGGGGRCGRPARHVGQLGGLLVVLPHSVDGTHDALSARVGRVSRAGDVTPDQKRDGPINYEPLLTFDNNSLPVLAVLSAPRIFTHFEK